MVIRMTRPNASGKPRRRARSFAVLAVLIMVFSAFAMINDRSSDVAADVAPQTSLQATVVYHACDTAPSVSTDYNYDTPSASRSVIVSVLVD